MFQLLRRVIKAIINDCCYLLLISSFCRQKKTIKKEKIKKILCINLQGMGDVIMTTAFLNELRKFFPSAQIDYCCYKNNANLLENDTRINNLIKRKEGNLLSRDFLNTVTKIRCEKYDLIINLYHAQHSALLTVLSNAEYKMGNLHNTSCTTNNLACENSEKTRDVRKNAKHVAQQLGIPEYDETNLQLHIKKTKKKMIIGINPSTSWKAKSWPKEHWITLINELLRKYKKHHIVLIGGPNDIKIAKDIENTIKSKRIQNLAGKEDLTQLAQTIQSMTLFITPDSGPLQIAVATKTKTIALYGVTDPERIVGRVKHVKVLSTYDSCPTKWKYNHNNIPPQEAQTQIAKITPAMVMKEVKKMIK